MSQSTAKPQQPTPDEELRQLETCVLNLHLLVAAAINGLKAQNPQAALEALVGALQTTRSVAAIYMNKIGLRKCGKCSSTNVALEPGPVNNTFVFKCTSCDWVSDVYNPLKPASQLTIITKDTKE